MCPREPGWEPRHRGRAPNSTPVIDSVAARLPPSTKCPYTSLVIAMLAWPKHLGEDMKRCALGERQQGT